jgi:hypothetical protein
LNAPSLRNRRLAYALFGVLGTLASGTASGDDRAAAQQLFQEGKRLMAAGKVAEACPKFEAAAQLSQTPGVRLNLADCWALLGRTASAWAKYEEARDLAGRLHDAAAVGVARRARAALEPKLSFLTVNVSSEPATPDLQVSRDGDPVPRGAWGTALPVDPGEHEIVAEAQGRKRWSVKVAVPPDGAKETVTVPLLAQEESAPPITPEPPSSRPNETQTTPRPVQHVPSSTQRNLAWVSGGLGIAGVAVGSVLGLVALSKKSTYQSHVGPDGQCVDSTCQTSSHSAYAAGTAATIAFVAGGAFLLTGGILWLTAPVSPRQAASSARLVLFAGPSSGGVLVAGRWR